MFSGFSSSACNGSEGGEEDEDTHPFQEGHFISASLEEPEVLLQENIKQEMPDDDTCEPKLLKRPLLTSADALLAEHISNSTATLELLKELIRVTASRVPQQEDHLDKFFEGMAATVRNLPPSYQTKAKKMVADLVLQLESEAQENADIYHANPAKRKKKEK